MPTTGSRWVKRGVLVLVLALLTAACGDDDDGSGGSASGGENLSGSIFVSGSSTVEPITALVAEKFSGDNKGVSIKVDGPGTGDGFKLFCKGDTDASDASRAIKDEEVAACAAKGIEFIELKVAVDGLSVITSHDNDAVSCLSFADLYALVGPESQGFRRWSDANVLGKEIGGSGDYPDADLQVTAPGEESGTYDSFVELVLTDVAEERGQEPGARKDYTASPNDNVIIDGISGSRTSLGWVGFAFLEENLDKVKAVGVEEEEGKGCVEPTADTIADGSFPISRPLFFYVNRAKLDSNPALAAFVEFYLSEDGISAVEEASYVPLEEAELEKTRQTWEARTTGKVAS